MNKSALKRFATEARKELLERVELQARKIGITAESIQKANVESSDAVFIDGRQLSDLERRQRNKLITRINEIGFNRVMEETAYTWFNRFIALRFMEVNDYLPTKVRVLSSSNGDSAEPDMMKEALSLDLDLDKEYVYELKMNNKTDELFKYLIKMHCNDLNRYMPFMFETLEDYKEILFPEGLLGTASFVRQLTDTVVIPEKNWEKIEVIGWLYQYYISEEKDEVFSDLKRNIKITKEKLPAATQLFTPNWIVRYMVENSLGRIWLESYPDSPLKTGWKYYLDEAKQEEEVIKQLEEIRYNNENPEDITFLDPCCGSGHILVYAFDVFFDMYLEKGYLESEIPQLILEKNLYGIDVDDRAVQLASFAVMMKAREKSRRIFRHIISPNICAIQESNWLTDEMIINLSGNEKKSEAMLRNIRETFFNAKDYGSLLCVDTIDISILEESFKSYKAKQANLIEILDKQIIEVNLPQLLKQSRILAKKYDVVCTNPPYMGNNNMNDRLKVFLQENYEKGKADLFSAFIVLCLEKTKKNRYCSLITMHSWFFLSSFELLRKEVLEKSTISSILHLGMEAFDGIIGKVVQTGAFIIRKINISDYKPTGIRLVDYYDSRRYEKEKQFFNIKHRYTSIKLSDLHKIPGSPIAYWLTKSFAESFNEKKVSEYFEVKSGIMTGNDPIHLRFWYEVEKNKINFYCKDSSQMNNFTWFPINKGGDYRIYYGNNDYVVNLRNDGENIKNKSRNYRLRDKKYYFKNGITWSRVTSSNIAFRENKIGTLFGDAGPLIFVENKKDRLYTLAFLTSKVTNELLKFINPTLNYQIRDIETLPIIMSDNAEIVEKVEENILISKTDWDNLEESSDFKRHPILNDNRSDSIKVAFNKHESKLDDIYQKLKNNAEYINKYFIQLYGLESELTPEMADNEITIRKADLERDIKSFISYAIGCSFGRYSLDEEGLIYAGGEFDASRYQTFPVDEDNILPILPGAYFEDDIVSRFVDFVRITFSEETLEENLDFIADAIGRKANETAREALRRYFLNDFYKDHVQVYKKRPIYWLFSSGKEKAFNCLLYMHRYDKTTLSRIRTDYLHEVQIRMDAEKKDLLDIIEGDYTAREINNAKRELKSLDKKIDELKAYDELLHHMADMQIEIDLDDGVKVNYDKFKGLVAKI
ncbi:BREX-1 system adenine-specific DNA-methyltransferase PglX [Heyndrickxia oleronia]|jgi:type II restriction/modification system DNA methylase subunit YeeA|uniref:BREX-1 system adenine-specific DNA-methyltransferase PglX n=1 Tax=Heyndrickxia oleronia TaxID=38875 RepID=UPI002432E173|nr:BREX-1 system adenine-specific DNA-methyltransferase PglX [Heyndrickxia oleronia]MCI1589807.1 BREX-1 system adenine-specific DNA-methyltransferase PglX [Heyndrickxia oleronia]MCI1613485.1 BREX-1 system adenine-specific DNA-methyltransferase PglX [Heyndrickxia oleronia]MCI1744400.1 BREX-1 system adenine-specific DNA-methyltransferase PglX [Heyndrickxia oleronia]MCI1763037.1 BREX-1 system adenine-specific DNA-methyltransferase PglX [Heyndrickxia oleronia]